jgi:alkylhydroperoxidase family enzyme
LLALAEYATSPLFTPEERLALEYADAMTLTERDVGDDLFARLRAVFDDDALVELTATIAWENASSRFNRALRVPSQGLWRRRAGAGAEQGDAAGGRRGGEPAG